MISNLSKNIPIVAVAFNRPQSLSRLLSSLDKAKYPNTDIPLIISIDQNKSNQEVLDVANKFIWRFGKKQVRYQETNLGLKKHIIQCGKISFEYGAVIILEDDLYVSKDFYFYATDALKFSLSRSYIGGVSLYNHRLNQHNFEDFSSLQDKYDNWYFQYAASWGQAWSSQQFRDFLEWYETNENLVPNSNIPQNVLDWSDKSWLKFFIAYLVETKKYFIYPKISYSTNVGDSGTHFDSKNTTYQVPISYSEKTTFSFSEIEQSKSIYDAFYENITLYEDLALKKDELCIDLYGYKTDNEGKRFYITSKILDFKVLESFAKSFRPIETNVIEGIHGKELFLYDTSTVIKNKIKKNKLSAMLYNYRAISYQSSIYLAIKLTAERIIQIFSNK